MIGILHRIDRRLIGIADTLSYDGRLVVIKSIISAIPNFAMCTLKLPLGFLDYIEGSTRGFFWRGKDIHKKGKCLVKWENVCKPKRVGGLGVLNLRKQNIALLMKHLFKFMNREDLPWVKLIWQAHYTHDKIPQNSGSVGSFWWKDCINILNTFLEIATCAPGDGGTVRLWLDQWTDEMLRYKLPHLCSFAKSQSISLKQAVAICVDEDIADMFHIPLSVVANQQCDQLEALLTTSTEQNMLDKWTLAPNGKPYSSKRVYDNLMPNELAPPPFRWIWKSCTLPKHKIFFWLLLQDRLNTRGLLARKNFMIEDYDCVLCNQGVSEDYLHLFFECDFSRNFWWKLLLEWNNDLDLFSMLLAAKKSYKLICFKEILIVGCWSIWNHRNRSIFDNQPVCLDNCFEDFIYSFKLIMHRAKPSLKEGMTQWVDTL